MGITDLLNAIGDENMRVQFIDECTSQYQFTAKNGNKLTVHTDEQFTANGMEKFGIVIWVDRDKFKEAQSQPADALDAETIKKAARYDWIREQGAIMDGSGHPNYWRCMAVLGGSFSCGLKADDIIDAAMADSTLQSKEAK